MAALALPAPGTEYGPCTARCEHRDCQQTRAMAKTPCRYCDEPIGYGTRFFQDGTWTVLTHMVCELAAVERERTDQLREESTDHE